MFNACQNDDQGDTQQRFPFTTKSDRRAMIHCGNSRGVSYRVIDDSWFDTILHYITSTLSHCPTHTPKSQ